MAMRARVRQSAASASSSSQVSRHEAAAAFARTCSGFVAPAMIEPIPGVDASALMASSWSEWTARLGERGERLDPLEALVLDLAAREPRAGGAGSPRWYFPVSRPLASGKYGM